MGIRTVNRRVFFLLIGVLIVDCSLVSAANQAVVNKSPLTFVNYNGTKLNVYESKSNNIQKPRRMTFYYEPIMKPNLPMSSAVRIVGKELRVSLLVGNDEIKQLILTEVKRMFGPLFANTSDSWTIAPLMFQSVVAYIVSSADTPVANVHPFRETQLNKLNMELRFLCSNKETAEVIRKQLLKGQFQIEMFYAMRGMKESEAKYATMKTAELQQVFTKAAIHNGNDQAGSVHIEWRGKKIEVNLISKLKLTDLPDTIQVELITKQLMSDKRQGTITRTVELMIPVPGEFRLFTGRMPPQQWLICDGSAVSRKQFSQLFKAIGEKYGAGDGNTTFNLPDSKSAKLNVDLSENNGSRSSNFSLSSNNTTTGEEGGVFIIYSGVALNDGIVGHNRNASIGTSRPITHVTPIPRTKTTKSHTMKRHRTTRKPITTKRPNIDIMACEAEAVKKFCSRPKADGFTFTLCNSCWCSKGEAVCTKKNHCPNEKVKSCDPLLRKIEKKYQSSKADTRD